MLLTWTLEQCGKTPENFWKYFQRWHSLLLITRVVTIAWISLDEFVESFIRNLKMKINPVSDLVYVPVCTLSWPWVCICF